MPAQPCLLILKLIEVGIPISLFFRFLIFFFDSCDLESESGDQEKLNLVFKIVYASQGSVLSPMLFTLYTSDHNNLYANASVVN